MSEDFYHERLLALARSRRPDSDLEGADGRATRDNPLCGDRATVAVRLTDGRLERISQQARGCILCRAAAAVLAHAEGLTASEARETATAMADFLKDELPPPPLPDAAAFLPVRRYPSRHQCVLLPFEGLVAAIDEAEQRLPKNRNEK